MIDRRCKIAMLSLLLGVSSLANAAITLPLPWQQGLKVRYQSSTVQEKLRAGERERSVTSETTVIEIAEVSDKGYLQVWRSEAPSLDVTGTAADVAGKRQIARQLMTRFAKLPLKAELDPQGVYVGIRNWQEVGTALREVMLPFMVRQAHARPELAKADEAKIRELLGPALQRMTTREAVNSTIGKQVALYNFFTGPSLTPGKPVSYEDTLASPWSPDVFPSVGSFELTDVDDEAGTVTIRWQQSIDPVKGATAARKMVETLLGKPLPEPVTEGLPKGLDLSDHATVVLDRKSGLPLSVLHRREIVMGGSSTVTTWTMKKLADKPKP